jgi:hypothetical protein
VRVIGALRHCGAKNTAIFFSMCLLLGIFDAKRYGTAIARIKESAKAGA